MYTPCYGYHKSCGYFRANQVLQTEIEQCEQYLEGIKRLTWVPPPGTCTNDVLHAMHTPAIDITSHVDTSYHGYHPQGHVQMMCFMNMGAAPQGHVQMMCFMLCTPPAMDITSCVDTP